MFNSIKSKLGSRRDKKDRSAGSMAYDSGNVYPGSNPTPTRRPDALAMNNPFLASTDAPPAYSAAPNSSPLPPIAATRDTTSAVPPTDDPYSVLSTFDTVFLIDDSSSMTWKNAQGISRWSETADALASITPICTAHDEDGIDIHFLNTKVHASHRGITSAAAVQRIFQTVQPRGGTPIGWRLDAILRPYLRAYKSKPDATKPLNVICITDGKAGDDPESVLIDAAKELDRLGAPSFQVGVQFFQVGDDRDAGDYLRGLDDDLRKISGDVELRDIVDTVPFTSESGSRLTSDGILKVVLGAVNRRRPCTGNKTVLFLAPRPLARFNKQTWVSVLVCFRHDVVRNGYLPDRTMPFFEAPASWRLRQLADAALTANQRRTLDPLGQTPLLTIAANATMDILKKKDPPHSNHPDFLNLAGLVSEAVLEVVFVALPGFLVAWTGMFDANSQKFVAELNTMVFTPCLIFTKLASQLNADRLKDLVIIPFIFAALTLVSYVSAQIMVRLFGFNKQKMQKNFVIAMGVFGNSNSLPISLVLSLSQTIQGLHWDKVPGDNDNEVGARGILYLLIFQQLGQLLRWTWGYSVLLKPASAYEQEEPQEDRITEEGRYRDDPDDVLHADGHVNGKMGRTADSGFSSDVSRSHSMTSGSDTDDDVPEIIPSTAGNGNNISNEPRNVAEQDNARGDDGNHEARSIYHRPNGNLAERARSTGHITLFPNFASSDPNEDGQKHGKFDWKLPFIRLKLTLLRLWTRTSSTFSTFFHNLFRRFPQPVQKVLSVFARYWNGFWAGVWRQMNPPLWAMLAALIVASIPQLQHLFFKPGTLINNSVTSAIKQSGGVAVPLILVVLGANLARSTLPQDQLATTPEEKKTERKLVTASVLARMVIPTIVMTPRTATGTDLPDQRGVHGCHEQSAGVELRRGYLPEYSHPGALGVGGAGMVPACVSRRRFRFWHRKVLYMGGVHGIFIGVFCTAMVASGAKRASNIWGRLFLFPKQAWRLETWVSVELYGVLAYRVDRFTVDPGYLLLDHRSCRASRITNTSEAFLPGETCKAIIVSFHAFPPASAVLILCRLWMESRPGASRASCEAVHPLADDALVVFLRRHVA
nr:putative transporter [Quercus suber]